MVELLRNYICEVLGGSEPSEAYDRDLTDDDSWDEDSTYVRAVRAWLSAGSFLSPSTTSSKQEDLLMVARPWV